MIKIFEVVGLNGAASPPYRFHLNDDINIVTGRNGAGKTTILKLMWYLISGNIERIFPEINFESVTLETDRTFVKIVVSVLDESAGSKNVFIVWRTNGTEMQHSFVWRTGESSEQKELNRVNSDLAKSNGYSVFFPTFRRIEGGFSIVTRPRRGVRGDLNSWFFSLDKAISSGGELQGAMASLSEKLTVMNHAFVASISTDDIIALLTKRYADISENTNRRHNTLSTFIIETIRAFSHEHEELEAAESDSLTEARSTLNLIEERVKAITEEQDLLLRPFSVLSDLIERIFHHKGIKVTEAITLGDVEEAISSDALSAGEKQMLSFICYNAFKHDCVIFIDEPEISLHVDWQRILFPTLLSQAANNQFIIATHSPFIYSKFPDKELSMLDDRGGD